MTLLNIAVILGTRPEIMKLASVITAAKLHGHTCRIVHTGQHYDNNMSAVFFKDLSLSEPDVFLGIGSGTQGEQTGVAIAKIEQWLSAERPDVVIVVGDTNAGLSAVIAASKLNIPVAHYEAGARSHDWTMPEEINRRIMDAVSTICFSPTQRALETLTKEGRGNDSWLIGDTLVETALKARELSRKITYPLTKHGVLPGCYGLVTIHRAHNTDDPLRISKILNGFRSSKVPLLFPIHPRTLAAIERHGLGSLLAANTLVIEPRPYLEFLSLLCNAAFVITDSGGVQQESTIFKIPALTLRENTEWVETIECGVNRLVDVNTSHFAECLSELSTNRDAKTALELVKIPFELGAAEKSLAILLQLKEQGRLKYRVSNFLVDGY